jgi:hypothetical protein
LAMNALGPSPMQSINATLVGDTEKDDLGF